MPLGGGCAGGVPWRVPSAAPTTRALVLPPRLLCPARAEFGPSERPVPVRWELSFFHLVALPSPLACPCPCPCPTPCQLAHVPQPVSVPCAKLESAAAASGLTAREVGTDLPPCCFATRGSTPLSPTPFRPPHAAPKAAPRPCSGTKPSHRGASPPTRSLSSPTHGLGATFTLGTCVSRAATLPLWTAPAAARPSSAWRPSCLRRLPITTTPSLSWSRPPPAATTSATSLKATVRNACPPGLPAPPSPPRPAFLPSSGRAA
jgi:hypothetical protein